MTFDQKLSHCRESLMARSCRIGAPEVRFHRIPLITNLQLAQRFVEAIAHKQINDLEIKSWGEYGN
jgi:hypothetical protein